MNTRKLNAHVRNFVEAYMQAAGRKSPGEPRWFHCIGRCQALSRRLGKELSLEKYPVHLVYGEFHAPATAVARRGICMEPTFTKSGQELPPSDWCPHYWLVVGNHIVDCSIEQFLNTRKYIRSLNDPHYRGGKYGTI